MALRIAPKTNYYHSNGSGRDTYILEDSGGLTIKRNSKPLIPSSRFMKFGDNSKPVYSSNAKIIHYASDGTGRDVYIGFNSGGLTSQTPGTKDFRERFTKSLRNGQKTINEERFKNYYKIDSEKEMLQTKKQRVSSARLSLPKKIEVPFYKLLAESKGNLEG